MQEIETHPFSEYVNLCNGLKGGFIPRGTKVVIFGTNSPKIEYYGKGDGFFHYSSPRNHLYVRVDNLFINEPKYQPLKKQNTKTYMNLY
ncbi:MAG TPA: hypothetical protein VEZ17_13255 [Chitinophagaceae bacterium]|jgi:G:T/U-mismatch repair DNA glycosylase|nr:hypothetical protein [Chitinophagaceae bacterium]